VPDPNFASRVRDTLDEIARQGLSKPERVMVSRQGATVRVAGPDGAAREALNLCGNNYLGLAGDERVAEAAIKAVRDAGAGFASVRFICGTHALHKELEARTADYLGYEDAILFAAAFDANGGVFEPLLSEEDAIVSDSLNHASIIDGVRLCKAARYRYPAGDMGELEAQLKAARAAGARTVLIVTDGVFSMDGYVAPLKEICDLADRYDAMVMVDDSHAVGFVGPGGRGTPELHGVMDRVDIITGTLGKALGGASGGYVAARAEIVALLRQRSRPYLFSNTLAPVIAAASLKVLDLLESADDLRIRLAENTALFRSRMTAEGFDILPGDHAIAPVMIGDASVAGRMAELLLERGVYVIGFSYPVVPQGQARIRVQLSAAHSTQDVNRAVDAFVSARAELES
jgi:glycine C-acetyltransferase